MMVVTHEPDILSGSAPTDHDGFEAGVIK
jgi:hypothetical protein